MTTNVKTPCPTCPWRRDSQPGSLGGSLPERFIGQAHGPFMLPCHMHYGERSYSEVHGQAEDIPQCAGAAVYRANVGVIAPAELHSLPPDAAAVFATPEEFIAHHRGTDTAIVSNLVEDLYGSRENFVRRLVRIELARGGVRVLGEKSK